MNKKNIAMRGNRFTATHNKLSVTQTHIIQMQNPEGYIQWEFISTPLKDRQNRVGVERLRSFCGALGSIPSTERK
jgi:hypothetical protein